MNDSRAYAKIPLVILVSLGIGFAAAKRVDLGEAAGWVLGIAIAAVGIGAVTRLGNAPREMWLTFCLKLFTAMAYKIMYATLVLWLTSQLGFSDKQALSDKQAYGIIAGWSIFMSLATILSGSVTDAIGLRRTLCLGLSLCVLSRLVMVFTPIKWMAIACGLFPLAVGEALCTPVLVAAARRFTIPSQRSIAFSLLYAILNLGFLLAYFLNDAVSQIFQKHGQPTLPLFKSDFSEFRVLLLLSTLIDLLILPLVLFMRRGALVTEAGLELSPEIVKHPEKSAWMAFRLTVRDAARDTLQLFSGLIRQQGFHRLLMFLVLIGLMKAVFSITDLVLPKFVRTEVGAEMGSRVGRINAVNSILILFLAPLIAMITRKFSAYSMVVFGGFITAFSFVFMVLPPASFRALAEGTLGHWIGHGYMKLAGAVHPYYVIIILWQVAFSIGEAFYSPRVYEYAASIAPKGQEATYSSLSYIPMLIGKLVTSLWGMLGFDAAERIFGVGSTQTMWTLIGLLVLIAPVGLLIFKRWIRVEEVGRGT